MYNVRILNYPEALEGIQRELEFILDEVETVKCIERQIEGYIKKETMLLPLSLSKPIDYLSIKLRAVSIGEEVKAEIVGMINRDKIEASYTLDSGSITKSERYNMYIFYKPNRR